MSLHTLSSKDLKYVLMAVGLEDLLADKTMELGATALRGELADSSESVRAGEQLDAEKAMAKLIDNLERVMNKLTGGEYKDMRKLKYGAA